MHVFWPLCPWNIQNTTPPSPWVLFLSVGNNQKTCGQAVCGLSLSLCLRNSQNLRPQLYGFSVSSASWNIKSCLQITNVFFLSFCVGNDQNFEGVDYVVALFLPQGISKHQMHRLMGSVFFLPWEGSKSMRTGPMCSFSLFAGKWSKLQLPNHMWFLSFSLEISQKTGFGVSYALGRLKRWHVRVMSSFFLFVSTWSKS